MEGIRGSRTSTLFSEDAASRTWHTIIHRGRPDCVGGAKDISSVFAKNIFEVGPAADFSTVPKGRVVWTLTPLPTRRSPNRS